MERKLRSVRVRVIISVGGSLCAAVEHIDTVDKRHSSTETPAVRYRRHQTPVQITIFVDVTGDCPQRTARNYSEPTRTADQFLGRQDETGSGLTG